jgi:hypothetical protein
MTAPASRGDAGELPVFAIIGELEPIEFRLDSMAARLRIRRMMKKARTHVVAIARNPSTTMTAMAQCGKLELLAPDWTAPVGVAEEWVPLDPRGNEEPVVDGFGSAAVAVPAAVEAIEARTESANVVSANWTSART